MTEPVKKTVKLYNNSVTIFFNSASRNRYVIGETGESPVGVTTILSMLGKEGLALWPMYEALEWLKKNPKDFAGAEKAYTIKSDLGKNVGSEVHEAIELFLTRVKTDKEILEAALKPLNAFTAWFTESRAKVLATEAIVYSKEFDYAGTFDALLEIDGKIVLCDIKTTNISRTAPLGIYPEMFLQLGAYSLAYNEEISVDVAPSKWNNIDDLMIVRVGKDGVLNTLRASELGLKPTYLEDTFKHLVEVYRMITPLKKQLGEMNVATV